MAEIGDEPEIYDALKPPERVTPDCGFYNEILLRVKGKCHPIYWCGLVEAPCGLFPPRRVPSAWEPICWKEGEILT